MIPFLCPVCRRPLTLTQSVYQCEKRHSFDLSRFHYVNLIPVSYTHLDVYKRQFLFYSIFKILALRFAGQTITHDDLRRTHV